MNGEKEMENTWRCPNCWQWSEGMNPKGKKRVSCPFCGCGFEVEPEKEDKKSEAMEKKVDPFSYTERELYQLCYRKGEQRFGSPCKHEFVKDGRCRRCLRKVVGK